MTTEGLIAIAAAAVELLGQQFTPHMDKEGRFDGDEETHGNPADCAQCALEWALFDVFGPRHNWAERPLKMLEMQMRREHASYREG